MIFIQDMSFSSSYDTEYNIYARSIRLGYQLYCYNHLTDLMICSDYLATSYIRIKSNTQILGQNNLRAIFPDHTDRTRHDFLLSYGANFTNPFLII
jgi:hypothetical protein